MEPFDMKVFIEAMGLVKDKPARSCLLLIARIIITYYGFQFLLGILSQSMDSGKATLWTTIVIGTVVGVYALISLIQYQRKKQVIEPIDLSIQESPPVLQQISPIIETIPTLEQEKPKNRSSKILTPGVIIGILTAIISPILGEVIVVKLINQSFVSQLGTALSCMPLIAIFTIPICKVGAKFGQSIGHELPNDNLAQSPWAWFGAGLGGFLIMVLVIFDMAIASII